MPAKSDDATGGILRRRLAYVVLLALCGAAYFAFHAFRDRLPSGAVRDSLPSLLTPLAMFSVIELMPNIRFHTQRIKYTVLAATTLIAAVWLEAVVPRWTPRASGDVGDAVAMGVGFVLFCLYDLAFGGRGAPKPSDGSGKSSEPIR